jgi:predicted ATPase/DNA-binding SARP family transcriptional activator
VRFNVLGSLQVIDGHGRPARVGGRQSERMLAFLLVHANELMTKHALIEALGAEQATPPSVNAVQTLMSRLRRALPRVPIETVGSGYVMRVGPDELDALRFERATEAAMAAARMQAWGRARDLAAQALESWRGEPLPEFAGEEFARTWSAHLTEVQLQAVECNIEALLALGHHRRAVADLAVLVDRQPYRERFWGLFMLALYRCGRQSEALQACQRLRTLLIDDLGVSPGRDIAQLEVAILNQDASLDWRPPATSAASPTFGATPGPITGGLIGRDQLVADVGEALRNHRLVTLTGIGGVGKTSVARAVAEGATAQGFTDGFRFVELAALSAGAAVSDAMLGALRAQRASAESDEEALVRVLQDVTALLVVDNCEHVLDAVRELVDRLLAECAHVHVLATSREPLGIPGEHLLPVPPLAAPPAGPAAVDALEQCTAVQLFVRRARVVDEAFALDDENAPAVAAITRYLGGVPLALELAAARLDVETIGELTTTATAPLSRRLTAPAPADGRTGSVWGSLRWSVDLLTPEDRGLFEAVSIFAGPFTRDMALRVCSAPDSFDASFDRVVRASLLGRDAGIQNRFRMLEPVKEYARSLVSASEHERLAERHRVLMMARARRASRDLLGAGEKLACDTMRADLPDYRAAMSRLIDGGSIQQAAVLLVDLFQFCHFQMVPDGNQWARDLAWLLEEEGALAAKVNGAGALGAWFEGDTDLALRLGDRAVRIAERAGVMAPTWARLAFLNTLANAGRTDELPVHFRALIMESRASPEPFWRINGLGYEVLGRLVAGDLAIAAVKAEDALQQARGLQNPDCLHWALHCYGRMLDATGDLAGAAATFGEAIAVTSDVGSSWNLALDLLEWARAQHGLGNDASAATAMYELLGLIRESGNRSQLAGALGEIARILAGLGEVDAAAFALMARMGMPDLHLAAGVGGSEHREDTDARVLAALAERLPPGELPRLRARAGASPDSRIIAVCREALERAVDLESTRFSAQPAGRVALPR